MIKGVFGKVQLFLVISVIIMGICFLPKQTVLAATATAVKVFAVDYSDESIYVLNNDNTRIYYAVEKDAAKNNWEVIDTDTDEITMIDMSWLSPNTDNTICIKGEENSTQTRVVVKKKTTKLEVSIRYEELEKLSSGSTIASLVNIMTTEGTGSNPIKFSDLQWKKGENGEWKPTDLLTAEQLGKFLVKGTDLYFRIAPVSDVIDVNDSGTPIDLKEFFDQSSSYQLMLYPGTTSSEYCSDIVTSYTVGTKYPDGKDGRRSSNEAKVKIGKMSSPIVVGIDGGKFTAEIKYGKEYRVTTTTGTVKNTSAWTKVIDSKIKAISLSDIILDGSDGMTDPFPAMTIEIRNYATSRTAASKVTEIALEPQRVPTGAVIEGMAPDEVTSTNKNIYVYYNGTKNISITIPSASKSNPYEYCVVKPDNTFSLTRAVWSAITKGTEVKVLSSKAVDGGTLYVRQKEIKSKKATATTDVVAYALASTYLTFDIHYPSIPSIEKATYTFTKNYSDPITFDVILNKVDKKPYETEIKTIKLGTKELKFTAPVTPTIEDPIDLKKVYKMTVSLDKEFLNGLPNCYSRALIITYKNGTVDKTSLKLTIQNATAAGALTLTPALGSGNGTTAVTVSTSAGTGNSFVYEITDSEVKDKTIENTVTGGLDFTPGGNISITADKYLTVYEINSTTKKIVKYKSIQIKAANIKTVET